MVTYDGLMLAAVAAECRTALVGGRISRVRQHNHTDLTLEIRTHGREALLFASVDARFPRVYLAAANPPVPPAPPNFCMVLRKYVQGSFIKAIQQSGFDRVLHVRTEAPDGERHTIVLEIMGKHSNMILISDPGRILGAAKMIGSTTSRYRQVLPGRDYIPPPGGKANSLEIDEAGFAELWHEASGEQTSGAQQIEKWLVSAFAGFGPFLAREVALRAGEASPGALWKALLWLRGIVERAGYSPVIHTDPLGLIDFVYPIAGLQIEGEQHARATICEALDAYYRSALPRWEFDRARDQLAVDVTRAVAARESTASSLDAAIHNTGEAERLQRSGEMLTANLSAVPRAADEAEVVDYYDPNLAVIRVPLDRKLSPKQNAEAYFRKARRVRDGASAAAGRIERIRQELVLLRAAQRKMDTLSSAEEIGALRSFLVERQALRPTGPAGEPKQKEAEFAGHRIRRHVSDDGLEILLGENSESNDYLTTRVARPDDVWLHARSVKGAHVVIRSDKKGMSIPSETLRQAAALAARNSDAKGSSLIPVDYTLRKYVRKPKGAAAGYVTYSHEKTIDVTLGG